MRNRVPDEATCNICGRHFDPSETRGWCPNPSCGEWQHPSFPIDESEDAGDAGSGGESPSTPTKPCPNCGNDVRADANFCKYCATQLDGKETDEPADGPSEADGIIQECPDCGADLSGIPSDRLSTCPICMFDLTPVIEGTDDAGGDEADVDRSELTECPNCGEDLTPIPSDMRTVCPGCRVDLEEGVEVEAGSPPAEPSEPSAPSKDTSRTPPRDTSSTPPPRDEPSPAPGGSGGYDRPSASDPAGTPLEEMAGIAEGYVQRLTEIGITTAGDLVAADPDTVSARTGISARRIGDWIADAPVDRDDVEPAGAEPTPDDSVGQPGGMTGEPTGGGTAGSSEPAGGGLDHQETRIQRAPDDLVLEVMGREITVTDGETVGREVRSAMVEAGAPEEDAVYVHRKHIRLEVDEEGFFLTRLGENSLTVNGRTVEKGSQVRIEDGDEIGFSEVVTATVSIR
jgi:hypothetical protein